jgi:type IV secretory pathway VirB6-like protein
MQTYKDLTAAVKSVATALNSSKDTTAAQADLDFAKSVAAGMEGATAKSLENAFNNLQKNIYAAQLMHLMGS